MSGVRCAQSLLLSGVRSGRVIKAVVFPVAIAVQSYRLIKGTVLFDSHAFSKVTWLVDVSPKTDSTVICQ